MTLQVLRLLILMDQGGRLGSIFYQILQPKIFL